MGSSNIRTALNCLINSSSTQIRTQYLQSFKSPLKVFRSLSTEADQSGHLPTQKREPIIKKRTGAHGQTSLLKQALKKGPQAMGSPLEDAGQVVAYSTAEEYNVRALHQRLSKAGHRGPVFNVLGEAIWIPDWKLEHNSNNLQTRNLKIPSKSQNPEVFIFESGSFVSWGVSPEEASKFLDTIIRPHSSNLDDQLELNPCKNPEKETMDYSRSSSGPMFEVDSDQIVVGPTTKDSATNPPVTPTRKLLTPFINSNSTESQPSNSQGQPNDPLILSKLAVSSALAKACRLSRYEAQLDEFLSKVEHVPAMLKSGNDSPLDKKEIVARYGELLELRQGLSLKEENLLDLPEWFWEDTGTEERHFKKILREFDFERRLRNLNEKLSMAIELQGRLFEFSNSKYSHRLEWVIILLIAFEVAHAIYVADHHRK